MPIGKPLTNEQKELIVKLRRQGFTIAQIATQMRLAYSGVQRYLGRRKEVK